MKRELILVDNFYEDPDAIFRYAMSLDYVYPFDRDSASGEGVGWRTSKFRKASECPFKSSAALITRLEKIVGEEIDRELWNQEYPLLPSGYPKPERDLPPPHARTAWWNACFHVKHCAKYESIAEVHSHTDRDGLNSVGRDGWTGIVYLNRGAERDSGLKTWSNIRAASRYDYMTDPCNWRPVDDLGNVFNRLILHRGGIPHSGSKGWGRTLDNGRTFQTFFFRVRNPRSEAAVRVLL